MKNKAVRLLAAISATIMLSTATGAVAEDYKPYSFSDVAMAGDQAVMVIQEPGNESATHSGLAFSHLLLAAPILEAPGDGAAVSKTPCVT